MRHLLFLFCASCLFAQPTIVNSCAGPTGTGSPTYKDHPDVTVAVGTSHIIIVTGETVTAMDKSCNVLSGYPLTFLALMAAASPAVTVTYSQENDPRVTYNEFIDRFMITVGTGVSGPVLLVSSSGDLSTATWLSSSFIGSGKNGDTTPHIGFNKWWTVITHDDPGNTSNYLAYVIPNADVAASPISLAHMLSGCGNCTLDYESFAATDHSTTVLVTDPLYIIGRGTPPQNCSNCTVTWHTHTVTGSDSNTPAIGALVDINTGSGAGQVLYNTPNTGPNQPGTTIPVRATESHRPGSFLQSGTHIYSAMNTGPKSGETYGGFVLFDVDMSGPSMGNVKRVFGGSTDFYGWADVVLDNAANLVVCGVRSSNTVYAEIDSWVSSDQFATVTGPSTLYAGSASYPGNGANGGWGTYGQSIIDPADKSKVWCVQQYGGSATNYQWTTRAVQYSYVAAPSAGTVRSVHSSSGIRIVR